MMGRRFERLREVLAVYLEPAALRMLFFGFSSGLPLLLVLGTYSFRLREAGVDLATIGFLSWVGLVYGIKWVWAPVVDRVPIPWLTVRLGRRRSWLLLSQIALAGGILGLGTADPAVSLTLGASWALFTAFASATQDVALDAYRIESAGTDRQAALAAMYQTGYRLGMIWSGAGALALAAWAEPAGGGYSAAAWQTSYALMALSACVGLVTTLLSSEPAHVDQPVVEPARGGLFAPFIDFFVRYGRWAFVILALIATYRISDVVMGIMANPFYQDMGFTKEEVAAVSKVFGVAMTLLGAFAGGAVAMRIGVMRTLFLGAVLSSATNLLFALLAASERDLTFLILVVSADNLAAGLASAAFVAYLSGLTNTAYSATQYALFSSLMLLLPKFLAGFSGVAVEYAGYAGFFTFTALIGVPVALLVAAAARAAQKDGGRNPAS